MQRVSGLTAEILAFIGKRPFPILDSDNVEIEINLIARALDIK